MPKLFFDVRIIARSFEKNFIKFHQEFGVILRHPYYYMQFHYMLARDKTCVAVLLEF